MDSRLDAPPEGYLNDEIDQLQDVAMESPEGSHDQQRDLGAIESSDLSHDQPRESVAMPMESSDVSHDLQRELVTMEIKEIKTEEGTVFEGKEMIAVVLYCDLKGDHQAKK